jgi:hypothetical protein
MLGLLPALRSLRDDLPAKNGQLFWQTLRSRQSVIQSEYRKHQKTLGITGCQSPFLIDTEELENGVEYLTCRLEFPFEPRRVRVISGITVSSLVDGPGVDEVEFANAGQCLRDWVAYLELKLADLNFRDLKEDASTTQSGLSTVAPDSPAQVEITKLKRSTTKGEARAKLISALTLHHEYADGGCSNQDPIGSNKLARLAGVSVSSASTFFKSEFRDYKSYQRICADLNGLIASLKLLNGEFVPHQLFRAARSAKTIENLESK